MNREQILGALARGYCTDANRHKVMDSTLVLAMAAEILALRGLAAGEADVWLAVESHDRQLAALRSKVAEARAEGMDEAAKVCDEVAANPSPMWEEAEYCWEHAAKDCAAAIRAKMKEVK